MAAEIVQDDDIARLERGNELLFDIGEKAFAVDRAVEDAGGHELVTAQRAEEGQRPPVAMRCKATQPVAFATPSAKRRHVGLDPSLIDEHQTSRNEPRLP